MTDADPRSGCYAVCGYYLRAIVTDRSGEAR